MTSKQRAEVTIWHANEKKKYDENPDLVFDMDKENLKYCMNDVSILKQGVGAYCERMMDLFDGLDPMEYCTLPSFCNAAFRKLDMPVDSIGVIPPRGYGKVNHSNTAIAWLEWQSHKLKLPIFHARNCNEIKIG